MITFQALTIRHPDCHNKSAAFVEIPLKSRWLPAGDDGNQGRLTVKGEGGGRGGETVSVGDQTSTAMCPFYTILWTHGGWYTNISASAPLLFHRRYFRITATTVLMGFVIKWIRMYPVGVFSLPPFKCHPEMSPLSPLPRLIRFSQSFFVLPPDSCVAD